MKIEFSDNLWVENIDCSNFNLNKENRIKAVTNIASITRGKLGFYSSGVTLDRSLRLYNRLLTESDGKALKPFQFIPIKISDTDLFLLLDKYKIHIRTYLNEVARFGYWLGSDDGKVLTEFITNMRCLLNLGINEDDIPFNTHEELDGFKVIIGEIPKQVYDHLITHDMISKLSESSRNKRYLKDVKFFNKEIGDDQHKISLLYDVETGYKTSEQATKDLSSRRLIKFTIAGWLPDTFGLMNLLKVRNSKNTQGITKETVDNIKTLILYDYK